ncbi:elongation factor P maturation arginine rhamnosyltransferase EarP [Inhella proteolytica]|uniref:Protein-arginine rhamnosyltransferase n=1 Tax=Inhella proteolytica TaxID=2795029 RepID=A0A931J4V0_9BURK|nr:elongation factor P maturation arginine rhamnosyltransferase EarP [Inhella proteolytica]MBH9576352.1 elongation factor P maturation arginine rhamnosyltransferase EarP [Inhella proteolytica]
MLWDLFCRVIDNHGDLGVTLRLARNLVERGQQVRLWVDDARALAWMAPVPSKCITIHAWPESEWPVAAVGDVVIETFGCALPEPVQARLARTPPLWLNLEYLSAEPYTLRSHRLPSPVMSGPARGLSKTFWYPGFVPGSGGLLREKELAQAQAEHDRAAFLTELGLQPRSGERLVSLFCYLHAPRQALLDRLSAEPTLLIGMGTCAEGLEARGQLRIRHLPWLDQATYDRLLWSCDVNVVRGEDSFVRAQWAGKPMLWHIYRQDDDAHAAKLQAYLDIRWPDRTSPVRLLWQAWNDLGPVAELDIPSDLQAWNEEARSWRTELSRQTDLCDQLLAFAETASPGSRAAPG